MSEAVFNGVAQITQPLALAALTIVVLFGLFRALLKRDVFPRLRAAHGAALLTRIVDRVFVLALIALLLGIAAYVVVKLIPPAKSDAAHDVKEPFPVDLAISSLDAYYKRDAEKLFNLLPATAKNVFGTVGKVAAQLSRETYQYPAPPKFRTASTTEISGSGGIAIFTAEFDEVSTWSERVVLTKVDGIWKLWNVDALPAEWPAPNTAPFVAYMNPQSFESAASKATSKEFQKQFVDRWIPPPGWEMTIEATQPTKGKVTCDVTSLGFAKHYVLRNVLGGCQLEKGQRVVVFGKIASSSAGKVEVSVVRYYPSTT